MKTLRDTATLVVLILLALTVRVETRDDSPISLATPAHAAVEQTPVWQFEPGPLPNTELEAEAETVIDTVHEIPCPGALALTGVVESARRSAARVWKLDGERVVIVLGDDGPADPPAPAQDPPAAAPPPCAAQRARTSC